jgi:hypothetical protein
VEIEEGDIDPADLSKMQDDAASGLLAAAMAAYLKYLAPGQKQLAALLQKEVAIVRKEYQTKATHLRTATNVAHLHIGLSRFLDFAEHVGAIDGDAHAALLVRLRKALRQLAAQQSRHQRHYEPARRFVDLLGEAIVSGLGHVAHANGGAPQDAASWGWEIGTGLNPKNKPLGPRVGYLDGSDVFLLPNAAFAAARKRAESCGDPFAINPQTLHKRLNEKGYLSSTEQASRGTLTVRRKIQGKRQTLLHMNAKLFGADVVVKKQPAAE